MRPARWFPYLLTVVACIFALAFLPNSAEAQIRQDKVLFKLVIEDKNKELCTDAFAWAMAVWRDAAPKEARFRLVAPGERADFTVRFAPQIDSKDPSVVGWIRHWTYEGRTVGEISVRSTYNFDCLASISMHEIGHLLGLPDDYKTLGWDSIGMLMGYFVESKPVLYPSKWDIERVRAAASDVVSCSCGLDDSLGSIFGSRKCRCRNCCGR